MPTAKKAVKKAAEPSPYRTSRGAAMVDRAGVHEVTTDDGRGVRTVHRVTANNAAEARAFVQAELDAAAPPVPSIVEVAGPAELAERERARPARPPTAPAGAPLNPGPPGVPESSTGGTPGRTGRINLIHPHRVPWRSRWQPLVC